MCVQQCSLVNVALCRLPKISTILSQGKRVIIPIIINVSIAIVVAALVIIIIIINAIVVIVNAPYNVDHPHYLGM